MNNIEDMITEIKPTEAPDLEETLSQNDKEVILDLTLKKLEKKPARRGIRRRVTMLVAASLLALGVITAYASGAFNWDSRLSQLLGINQSNKDLVDGSGLMINQSDTQNGVKIELISAIGDKYNVYITGEITLPEEADMSKTYYFGSFSFPIIKGSGSGGMSVQLMEDENPTDNIVPFIVGISREKGVKGKKCSVEIKDIVTANESSESEIAYPGTWNISWKLDYKDSSIAYHPKTGVTIAENKVTINKVYVSPLSVTLKSNGGLLNKLVDKFFSKANDSEAISPGLDIQAVIMSDGTRIEDFSGGSASSNPFSSSASVTFKNILDPDKVKAIIVNGSKIELK